MQLKHITIAAAIAAAALSAGCNYEEDDDVLASRRSQDAIARQQEEQKDGKDYTIWQFVHETSALYYLWNNNVPISYLDYSLYESPEALFESFRATDDRFSTVLNNYTETEDMFKNISTTDGINYQLYLDEGTDLIAVVEYVYDDSPAKAAGIERGFVIHKVNGTQLTASNYADLLDQETCTYTYSNIEVKKENGEKIVSYGADMKESKPITKKRMDINPVLKSTVIVKNGRRIGYFLYDSFSDDTDVLIKTIEKLAAKQIDDLVLDLRLNGGGFINTLDTLASMIVPEGNEGKLFLTETFNSLITSEFRRETQNRDFNKTYNYHSRVLMSSVMKRNGR
jgi:C-terminal processing protease CtpA/Prc